MFTLLPHFSILDGSDYPQAFNATNGDISTWQRTFPDIASYFNVPINEDQFRQPPLRPFTTTESAPSPLDPNSHATFVCRNSLAQWAKEEKVVQAWKTRAEREGLDEEVFALARWGFADAIFSLPFQLSMDMSKVSIPFG